MMERVLAAVEQGPGADLILEGSSRLAQRTGAELHVVHVAEVAPGAAGEAALVEAEQTLGTLVQRAAGAQPASSIRVIRGRPGAAIVEHARAIGADLIVLGPHAGGDLGARILGTTADRVVREADVPCLILRAPLPEAVRSVAAAIDFSDASRHAAAVAGSWTAALAEPSGPVTLDLLHVAWPVERQELPDGEEDTLAGRLVEVGATLERPAVDGARVQSHVLWSTRAADAIAEWTMRHGTDLLVLGTTGEGGLRRRIIGSVAGSLARRAACPVLLVPHRPGMRGTERTGAPGLDCVVTGVDLGAASVAAADWVRTEFAPRARHVFVHVIEPPDPAAYVSDGADARSRWVERAREEAAGRLKRVAPDAGAERHVRVGRPADELIAAADDAGADLIAVGGSPHPRGLWAVLGTTAEHLVRGATVPVLIVRGRPAGPPGHVVACIDDSDDADDVLHWADHAAVAAGATLEVVHVLSPRYVGAARLVSGMRAARDMEAEQERQASDWLRARVERAGLDADRCMTTVATGDPVWEVLALEKRRGADLLVLGSRGAGAIGSTFIGSVAYGVVRGATGPVLVVRGERSRA